MRASVFSTTDAPLTTVVETRPDDERTTPPAQGALGAARCPWTSCVWLCSADSMASKVEARALKLRSGANGTPFASVVYVTGKFTAFLITVRDAMAAPGFDCKKEADIKLGWTCPQHPPPTTMSKRSPSPHDRRGGHYSSRGKGRTRDYDGERRQKDARDDRYDRHDRPSRRGHPQDRSKDNGYSRPRNRRYDSGYRENERQRDSGWGSRAQGGNTRNQPVKRARSASRSRSQSPHQRKRRRSPSGDAPNGQELVRRPNRYNGDLDDERRVKNRDKNEDARSDRRRARSASRCV